MEYCLSGQVTPVIRGPRSHLVHDSIYRINDVLNVEDDDDDAIFDSGRNDDNTRAVQGFHRRAKRRHQLQQALKISLFSNFSSNCIVDNPKHRWLSSRLMALMEQSIQRFSLHWCRRHPSAITGRVSETRVEHVGGDADGHFQKNCTTTSKRKSNCLISRRNQH